MRVLITGSKGFIGSNLAERLKKIILKGESIVIYEFNKGDPLEQLDRYCQDCDFVFHLAGLSRSVEKDDLFKSNVQITEKLLLGLKNHKNISPIFFSSSIHVTTEPQTLYAQSKVCIEEQLINFAEEHGNKLFIYRLPNVFGKWAKPNYNSVVATFCFNIINKKPLSIENPEKELNLAYIDDLIDELLRVLNGEYRESENYYSLKKYYRKTVGYLYDLIKQFDEKRNSLEVVNLSDPFVNALYSTYLSYLNPRMLCNKLNSHVDDRGSFTELIKTINNGQVSVNVIKPGITKGNHWHNTKNEKFFVISGEALIRLKKVTEISGRIYEYHLTDESKTCLQIIPGYIHSITNISKDKDLIVLIWANEIFDPNNPDTYYAT